MKATIFAITISMLAAMPARSEERTALPEIIVGAPPPNGAAAGPSVSHGTGVSRGPAGTPERCDGGAGGTERSLGCLNEKLKREVDRVNPPVANIPPIDARSPDTKVGVVNLPAVQQQYGRNFGVSVYPYRPPAPVYWSPVGHH